MLRLVFDDTLVYEKIMSDYEASLDVLTDSQYLKIVQLFGVKYYELVCLVTSFTYASMLDPDHILYTKVLLTNVDML